ncbi:MAG: tetratricopeptide repeat protein [Candidatus Eisenbacteria bacterium]|nr:tetratricopeptide repeat protein [Candidatus Eisenbacteria bacterium]
MRLAREGAVPPGSTISASRADAYWTQAALAAMAQDPLRAAALFGTKLGFLAAQYEIPQVESMRFESRFSRLLRLPLPGMALLLGLAAFGAVLALGRNDRAGVEVGRRTRDLLLGLAFSAALICLFFVTGRFRLALVPSLAILASGALSAWPAVSPTRRIVAVTIGGLAIVASLLGARGIDAATSDGQFLFRLGVIAEKEQDLGLARERYAAAIAIDPNEAKARINLGTLLAREGRLEEARPLLERGVALDPLSSLGRISLGQVELVTGRPAEAVQLVRGGGGPRSRVTARARGARLCELRPRAGRPGRPRGSAPPRTPGITHRSACAEPGLSPGVARAAGKRCLAGQCPAPGGRSVVRARSSRAGAGRLHVPGRRSGCGEAARLALARLAR